MFNEDRFVIKFILKNISLEKPVTLTQDNIDELNNAISLITKYEGTRVQLILKENITVEIDSKGNMRFLNLFQNKSIN